MSWLEDLPPEIRLRIYEYLFQETLVHPNPILWANQPSCDNKTKFKQLQAEWPDPVGLSMTSKFFYHDPVMLRPFFANATFCFGVRWQWPAFKCFLQRHAGRAIDPACLITSIMDTTPLYCWKTHPDLDEITKKVLPNLKHIYLNLFATTPTCEGRVITKVTEFETDYIHDCDRYERNSVAAIYGASERIRCVRHRIRDPVKFALQDACVMAERRFKHDRLVGDGWAPHDFILANFFNDFGPEQHEDIGSDERVPCRTGRALKERIMNDDLTVHLAWELIFACEADGGDDISVNAKFSSSDWIMRYIWEGVEYGIPQTKPRHFNKAKRKFEYCAGFPHRIV